jgi:hypothetical protein
MTETEWLNSENPAAMLSYLGDGTEAWRHKHWLSDRKLRLLACACCRQVWPLLSERSREAVSVAERFADGQATELELHDAYGDAYEDVASPEFESELAWSTCSTGIVQVERHLLQWFSVSTKHAAAQSAILRDIVGNPWRPWARSVINWERNEKRYYWSDGAAVSLGEWNKLLESGRLLKAEWLTPAVLVLAGRAYEDRAKQECKACRGHGGRWDNEAIDQWYDCHECGGKGVVEGGTLDALTLMALADALEEAGVPAGEECQECLDFSRRRQWEFLTCHGGTTVRKGGELLAHLRGPGPHARGCWALDLILNKG